MFCTANEERPEYYPLSGRLNWDRARERDIVRLTQPDPRLGMGKSPTAAQTEYVKSLAQKAGEPAPLLLTRAQVSREIDRLRRKLRM